MLLQYTICYTTTNYLSGGPPGHPAAKCSQSRPRPSRRPRGSRTPMPVAGAYICMHIYIYIYIYNREREIVYIYIYIYIYTHMYIYTYTHIMYTYIIYIYIYICIYICITIAWMHAVSTPDPHNASTSCTQVMLMAAFACWRYEKSAVGWWLLKAKYRCSAAARYVVLLLSRPSCKADCSTSVGSS